MCGICGQINLSGNEPADRELIGRMTEKLYHRGPDDDGYFLDGSMGFGFRRLSIIDISGGHQPMSDTEQMVWVVFNGEIYNFPQLKKELERQGHVFQTNSDTEVIIHGYKEWGADVFNYLNGMFGLAIWDATKNRLLIARDPMGIKVVYFTIQNNRLFFASEIKAILPALNNKFDVDLVSLNLFLRYRYTPSPMTLFKGIQKLAPGTMLVIENGEVIEKRWYQFKPEPFSDMPKENEAKEELLYLYKKAVKRHLISDVPLGLLLSGGIDSGLLMGLMNLEGEYWKTYTIGYGDEYVDDELKDAAETSMIFNSDHTSIMLDKETFESTLPKIVSILEEPIASSSIVPMYFVSERARKDVKVALVGQGPDELFGGYIRHIGVHYGSCWRELPGLLKRPVTSIINSLPRNETLKRGVYSLNRQTQLERYQNIFSLLPGRFIDELFQDGLLPDNPGNKILECWKPLLPYLDGQDELSGFQLLELWSSLPDELLMYADKLSMAHSLEVRVPYLDKEVVEYAQRLDPKYKVRNFRRKWLHKKVCSDFLPKQFINRKKRGFGVNVVDQWFKSSVGAKMNSYLSDDQSLMYQFLKHTVVQKLLNEHIKGRKDNHKILFSLVVLEEWMRSIYYTNFHLSHLTGDDRVS